MKKTIIMFVLIFAGCGGGSTGISFNMDVKVDPGQPSDVIHDAVDASDTGQKDVITKDTPADKDLLIQDIATDDIATDGEVATTDTKDVADVADIVDVADVADIVDVADVADILNPVDTVTETDVKDIVTRPDAQGCPGAAGCTCSQDANCNSGLCTETSGGNVCAATCTQYSDCAAPLRCVAVGNEKYCIDTMPRQCMPCRTDSQCQRSDRVTGTPTAKCSPTADMKAGSFCLYQCTADQGCTYGYTCNATNNGLCFPDNDSGECGCSPLAIDLGASTDCLATSNPSVCKGTKKCLGSGLTTCVVPNILPEKCDGNDDNCNGKVDDGDNLPGCRYYCQDLDHDSFTVYTNCKCLCSPDQGHPVLKSPKKDCDDTNALIYPGSPESICGKDADCNGKFQDKGEACDDGNKTDWDGCNSCQIAEFKVNDHVDLTGVGDPGIAAIEGAGYVVAWPSYSGNGSALRFKRFDISGKQINKEQVAATADSGYFIGGIDACWAGQSKFVMAWTELKYDNNGGLSRAIPYMEVFNANGTAVTGKVKLSDRSDNIQYQPRLACRSGEILAVWIRRFSLSMGRKVTRAMYRFFDTSGNGDQSATEITGSGSNSFAPDVTHIGNDRYAIAYRNDSWKTNEVNVKLVTREDGSYADTTIVSSENLNVRVAISWLGPNTFGIGWLDNNVLKGRSYQYKDSEIRPIINAAQTISSNECPNVVRPGLGTFLNKNNQYMLAWTWECQKNNNNHVRMRVSNNHLVMQNQVNPAIYNTLDQQYPAVDGIKGRFMVVWDSFENVSSPGSDFPWYTAVAAQRFDDKSNRLYH